MQEGEMTGKKHEFRVIFTFAEKNNGVVLRTFSNLDSEFAKFNVESNLSEYAAFAYKIFCFVLIRGNLKKDISNVLDIELHGNPADFYFLIKYLVFLGIKFRSFSLIEKAASSNGWLHELMYRQALELAALLSISDSSVYWPVGEYSCRTCLNQNEQQIENNEIFSEGLNFDVIVPTLRINEFVLRECLESISEAAKLSPAKIHLYVIDDNPEPKFDIEFFTSIKNVEVFESTNIVSGSHNGVAATRNIGIDASKSPFICFIDSDDKINEQYFAELIPILSRFSNIGAVGSWLKTFGSHERVIPQWDNFYPLSAYSCLPPAGVLIWRRTALINLGKFNEDFPAGFEDFDLIARATSRETPIVTVPLPLYEYRRGQPSLSQSWNLENEAMLRKRVLNSLSMMCAHGLRDLIQLIDEFGTKLAIHEPSLTTTKSDILQNRKIRKLRVKLRNNRIARLMFQTIPIRARIFILNLLENN